MIQFRRPLRVALPLMGAALIAACAPLSDSGARAANCSQFERSINLPTAQCGTLTRAELIQIKKEKEEDPKR